MKKMASKKEFDLFDHPKTRKFLWILLYSSCLLTIILEVFLHRHGHFVIDGFFGFYALLGFVACSIAIFLAKVLGLILKTREDYYDESD